ncbi:AAA family ATPase [Heliobacterium gestii]|uniref:Nuclease SbcCD subunit C n=1 Tax=Heliomicrobium gestii TaxID=2699 RepID=A0A845L9P1_HELGE|nr:SMC family ATPase [Heliomicrobium gestii]MBM7866279.1 exonuclease SbcC [Heliomicrobium gestii]MZP42928.1 AAA family ATPase [Heliomicrobium gestii]
MRPIQLTIAGLHSFRKKQEIHFEQLIDAGVFGIFGKTGSGKSTILDAITLALYGEVVRAKNGTQGILNHGEKSLEVSFLFELGAGGERTRYRVERRYVRNDDISVNNKVSRLVRIDPTGAETVLEDRSRDMTRTIEKLLGMTCRDFTRAVVLPQGKFAEFLSLTGKERRDMLQRLFNLEKYGKELNERVALRLSSVARDKSNVERELAGLGDASDEAVRRAEGAAAAAKAGEEKARAMLKTARAGFEEAQEVDKLQKQRGGKEAEINAHTQKASQCQEALRALERAEQAERVFPLVQREATAAAAEQAAALQKQAAEVEAQSLRQQLILCERQAQQAEAARDEQEPLLMQRGAQLEEAQKLEVEIDTYRGEWRRIAADLKKSRDVATTAEGLIDERSTERDRLKTALAASERELAGNLVDSAYRAQVAEGMHKGAEFLREATVFDRANGQFLERQQSLERARRQQEQKGERAQDLTRRRQACEAREKEQVAQVPFSEEELSRLEVGLMEQRGLLARLADMEKQRADHRCAAGRIGEAMADCQGRLQRLEADCARLEGERQKQKDAYQERLLQDRAAMAALLASDLHPGDPCPVCGSLEHPCVNARGAKPSAGHSAEEEKVSFEQAMEKLERALRQGTGELEQARLEKSNLQTRQEMLEQELNRLAAAIGEVGQESRRKWTGAEALGWPALFPLHLPTELHRPTEQTGRSALEKQIPIEKAASIEGVPIADAPIGDAPVEKEVPTERENPVLRFEQWLGGAEREWAKQKAAWQRWRDELEQIRLELRQLGDQVTQAQAEHDASIQLAQVAEGESMQAKAALDEAQARWDEAQAAFRQALEPLGLAAVTPLTDGAEQVKALEEGLRRKDRRCDELRRQIQACQAEILCCEEDLAKAQQQNQAAQGDVIRLTAQLEAIEGQARIRADRLQAITQGTPALLLIEKNTAQLDQLRSDARKARETWQQVQARCQQAQDERTRRESAWEAARQALDECRREREAALRKEEFVSVEEVRDARLEPGEMAEKKRWVADYQDREKGLSAEFAQIESQLAGRQVSPEALAEKERTLAEATEQSDRATRERGAADQALKELQGKQQRWQALHRQGEELRRQEGLLGQLKSLFAGNVFVDFLAQEQVEFVAQQASEQLKRMTRNRYALEHVSDGGFVIRDDANGGVKRPVTSLSGGETFQASLALALALSAQIQLKGMYPLEFFFLDEGFGSLDADAIDVVMGTLERLQLGNRSIGVISHVQELQQRLSRRLVVDQGDMEGSRVRLEIG